MSRTFPALAAGVFSVITLFGGACHSGERSVAVRNSSAGAAIQVEEATGLWRVAARSNPGECLLALNRLPAGGGYGVHVEACSIDVLKSAAAWRPADGGFELLGSDRKVIARFRKAGEDAFVATDDRYRLDRAPMV